MEAGNTAENTAEREIYRRCPAAKTYTVDFLNKKRVQNNGIVPQYYVENSHEPIIPRELYMQVQEEMARRANLPAQRGETEKAGLQQQVRFIQYCLLPEVRRNLPQDCLE